jgi:hypothetical protein
VVQLNTWSNGAKASVVKQIIDENFSKLEESIKKIDLDRGQTYIKDFKKSEWGSGTIIIKQSEYDKTNPDVSLYMKCEDGYIEVFGGYRITGTDIELLSDIAYEGRVVIR